MIAKVKDVINLSIVINMNGVYEFYSAHPIDPDTIVINGITPKHTAYPTFFPKNRL